MFLCIWLRLSIFGKKKIFGSGYFHKRQPGLNCRTQSTSDAGSLQRSTETAHPGALAISYLNA
ncbi:hypothetical protein ACUXPM_005750 [Ralstonia sp. 151470066-2]